MKKIVTCLAVFIALQLSSPLFCMDSDDGEYKPSSDTSSSDYSDYSDSSDSSDYSDYSDYSVRRKRKKKKPVYQGQKKYSQSDKEKKKDSQLGKKKHHGHRSTNNVSQACDHCRKSRTKCSKKRPCPKCLKQDLECTQTWVPKKRGRPKKVRDGHEKKPEDKNMAHNENSATTSQNSIYPQHYPNNFSNENGIFDDLDDITHTTLSDNHSESFLKDNPFIYSF